MRKLIVHIERCGKAQGLLEMGIGENIWVKEEQGEEKTTL